MVVGNGVCPCMLSVHGVVGWSCKELLIIIYACRLSCNKWWLIFVLADASDLGRSGFVVFWKLELALYDGFVGICLLLTAIVVCGGSVFVAMSF